MSRPKLVARYLDGRVVKGYSEDFDPQRPIFHIREEVGGTLGGRAIPVRREELKALFFVKTFEGNADYRERKKFMEGDPTYGLKAEIRFSDGEVVQGSTIGYDSQQPGFFLIPPDLRGNNEKIFVVSHAVNQFRFL
jgi:hypothetical protein